MREAIRWALVLSALIHVALQTWSLLEARRWGRYAGAIGVRHPSGSPSLTGCYLAVVLPLAPVWLWPVFGWGLLLSGSVLGAVAAGVGVLVLQLGR